MKFHIKYKKPKKWRDEIKKIIFCIICNDFLLKAFKGIDPDFFVWRCFFLEIIKKKSDE